MATRPARTSRIFGKHVWTGAATETQWTEPIRPIGQDTFGAVFRVDLADGAEQLAYILHRGDAKDPGPDQSIDFAIYGPRGGSSRTDREPLHRHRSG